MHKHYQEQTKLNVVAALRAGVTTYRISQVLDIPHSTVVAWNKSMRYADVAPADETLLSRLNAGALPPAKSEKKANGFVKVAGEGTRPRESSIVIRKGPMTVEIKMPMDDAGLVSLIKAIGECNVL